MMTQPEIIKTLWGFSADIDGIRAGLRESVVPDKTREHIANLDRRMRRLIWTLDQEQKGGAK